MSLAILSIVLVAFSLAGIIKGISGFGLPLVALPILAISIDLPTAICILTIPAIATNAWQLFEYRSHASSLPTLIRLCAGGTIGVAIGTVFLVSSPGDALNVLLGLVIAAYVTLRVIKPDFQIHDRVASQFAPVVGMAAGALQGISGLAAPISVTFIHSLKLERKATIFAVSGMFLVFTTAQFLTLAVSKVFTLEILTIGTFALLPSVVGIYVGAKISKVIARTTADRLMLLILAIMAAQLMLTPMMK